MGSNEGFIEWEVFIEGFCVLVLLIVGFIKGFIVVALIIEGSVGMDSVTVCE